MEVFLQEWGVWVVTVGFFMVGLVGCVVPIMPGHLMIFAGAVVYRVMQGGDGGIGWWGIGVLVLMMVVSQGIEMVSGSVGARWFGGSKWGAIGAFVGAVVGLIFFPVGLLLGPLVGAFGFEVLFGKKDLRDSAVSGVGGVVGTLAGIGIKIGVGFLMIGWFLVDVFLVG